MNRWMLLATAVTATFGGYKMLADPPVNLQATTPGTAQAGHSNITGTSRAGFFLGNGSLLTNLSGSAINTGIITLTGSSATYMIRGSNNSGAVNATGVIGLANSPTGITYGGWFESKSSSGRALFGYASGTAGATYGIYGVASGNGGRAMFGLASNATGNTYGGWFQSNSSAGVGLYARNVTGGIGLRAEGTGKALEVLGKSTFNDSTQFTGGFVGIGPRTTAIATNEMFGLSTNAAAQAGMYVSTASGGKPYYGFYNVNHQGSIALDSDGVFRINNDGDHFTLGPYGNLSVSQTVDSSSPGITVANGGEGEGIRINQSSAGIASGLTVANSGTGSGITVNQTAAGGGAGITVNKTNASSSGEAMTVNQSGSGSGMIINMSNSSSGATGIDISHAGLGAGILSFSPMGYGVWGQANFVSTAAVIGDNTPGEAVIGRSISGPGIGAVVGRNDGDGGYGVRGFGVKDNSIGVLGQHGIQPTSGMNGYGVRGEILNGLGTSIGVYGVASGVNQYAGWFQGRSMTTGTKSFVIDYPKDPTNKMLMHYCTEGSVPLNAYSGNTTTDANGSAWVALPEYVEDINKDFRYQLTVIGDFAQAIIGKKIVGNRFQIKTSKPNIEVSWRVEGERNDRFVETYGARDVVEKPANWKGKYINPELYDVDKNRGIFTLPQANRPLASDRAATASPAKSARSGGSSHK